MKEYIEREAFVAELNKGTIVSGDLYGMGIMVGIDFATKEAVNAPAADVVEVRHGRWEAWMPDENGETREFICTGCRSMVEMSWKQKECDYEWCPYCGAKMDGGNNG